MFKKKRTIDRCEGKCFCYYAPKMESSRLSGYDRFEEEDGEGHKKDEEEAQQVSLAIGHVSQFARENNKMYNREGPSLQH